MYGIKILWAGLKPKVLERRKEEKPGAGSAQSGRSSVLNTRPHDVGAAAAYGRGVGADHADAPPATARDQPGGGRPGARRPADRRVSAGAARAGRYAPAELVTVPEEHGATR